MKQKKNSKLFVALFCVAILIVVVLIATELTKRGEQTSGNQGTPTATVAPTNALTSAPTSAPGAETTPTPIPEEMIPLVELTTQELKEGMNVFL